jgi:phytoene/squalene synthetase
MQEGNQSSQEMAASITKAASKQTYYTIRFLVDRQRVPDAYRAYAYFRWIDDRIDLVAMEKSERVAFIDRQKALMNSCYQGQRPDHLTAEEYMLADLILADQEKDSGLQSYIRNMMAVIDFDAQRQGRLISQLELTRYTQNLATSVTEALLHFIGHDQPSPRNETRYLAATGAHIAHMLRDTLEDIQAGFFNIPREYLAAKKIGPQDVESEPYRAWVEERAKLARAYFKSGKDYLAQVENIRCRIAGYAYIARFELFLDAIEREDYRLAPEYPQGNGLGAGIRMRGSVLSLALLPLMRR